jgi:hypothetical protein
MHDHLVAIVYIFTSSCHNTFVISCMPVAFMACVFLVHVLLLFLFFPYDAMKNTLICSGMKLCQHTTLNFVHHPSACILWGVTDDTPCLSQLCSRRLSRFTKTRCYVFIFVLLCYTTAFWGFAGYFLIRWILVKCLV